MHILHRTVDRFATLSDHDFRHLLERTQRLTFGSKENVLLAGQRCEGLYFIESGLTGTYRLDDGKMIFQAFNLPGSFATDTAALTSRGAATATILALEMTEVRYISRTTLLSMYETSEAFRVFGRRLLESLLVRQTELTVLQISKTARERYAHLLESEAELLRRVPLQYLASYLGMSRETLSRIRGKG